MINLLFSGCGSPCASLAGSWGFGWAFGCHNSLDDAQLRNGRIITWQLENSTRGQPDATRETGPHLGLQAGGPSVSLMEVSRAVPRLQSLAAEVNCSEWRITDRVASLRIRLLLLD
jgi:hypothetical protein